jgi:hypothetical protein
MSLEGRFVEAKFPQEERRRGSTLCEEGCDAEPVTFGP